MTVNTYTKIIRKCSLSTILSFFVLSCIVHAQRKADSQANFNDQLLRAINQITNSKASPIDFSKAIAYQETTVKGKEICLHYRDSFYKEVPYRVFIPASYNPKAPSPVILLLHGSVQLSSFEQGGKSQKGDAENEDVIFNFLSSKNYIIVRPIADSKRKFDWTVNRFFDVLNPGDDHFNRTYPSIVSMLDNLKRFVNVDHKRIFCVGHSDGADGAFMLSITNPDLFAGFVIYNSMFTNIYADNVYLKNSVNSSFYIVHSKQDELRRIRQTRAIITKLKAIQPRISYKEYEGKHFSPHILNDLPNAIKYMDSTERIEHLSQLYWESSDLYNNTLDWIRITGYDLSAPSALWQSEINVPSLDPSGHNTNYPYYSNRASYAIKGKYESNRFIIETSRIKEFDILIDQNMIDTIKPVVVIVNGKEIFNGRINVDKNILLNEERHSFDTQRIWINHVHVNLFDSVTK